MLTRLSTFLDDSTGIEKTLRLAQGIFTVLADVSAPDAAVPWGKAKAQVNLGRRYLRLHKWHPCFRSAYEQSARSEIGALEKTLQVAKWSFLGLYFLMEMPTVTNAMGITDYDWANQLQHEALKCWLYSLVVSVLLGYYQLLTLQRPLSKPTATSSSEKTPEVKDEKQPTSPPTGSKEDLEREKEYTSAKTSIQLQLIVDQCDIFLPGSAVGWIPVAPVWVGMCQSSSSWLAMMQVWAKVNNAD